MKYELKQKQLNQHIEQEQLIGYWAKTQGFSRKALTKDTNNQHLQAAKLATNILKNVKGEHKEVYRDCKSFLKKLNKGAKITDTELNLIYRHSRRIQRIQAKISRKATR